MKLVLTRKGDNVAITVDADSILLIEPQKDSEGTHIVMHPNLIRTVNETVEEINAALGAIVPRVAAAALIKTVRIRKK